MATKKTFKKDNPALSFMSTALEETALEADAEQVNIQLNKKDVPEGYKINPLYIEKKSKRVQLLLQPSVVGAIKELAKEKGISMNEAVNEAIKDYLQRNK